jgi:hypothetical protein
MLSLHLGSLPVTHVEKKKSAFLSFLPTSSRCRAPPPRPPPSCRHSGMRKKEKVMKGAARCRSVGGAASPFCRPLCHCLAVFARPTKKSRRRPHTKPRRRA